MTRKPLIFAITLLSLFAIAIAGCGGQKKPQQAAEAEKPAKREMTVVNIGKSEQSNEILSLASGKHSGKKGVFIGTGSGVYFCEAGTNAVSEVSDGEGKLRGVKASALCQEEGGKLWIGTDGYIYSYNSSAVRQFDESKTLAIIQGPGGEIWAGTENGLLLYNGNTGFTKFTKKSDNLPHDIFCCFAKEEKAKNILAGTKQGLVVVDGPKSFSVKSGTSTKITPSGEVIEEPGNTEMAGNTISAIAFNSKGVAYIGTNMGLNRCKNFSNWSTFSADSEVTAKTSSGIGFKKIKGNSELLSNWIRSIYVDGDDALWIGTTKGLSFFDGDGKWENLTSANGLSNDKVNAVAGIDKTVYIGTARGLCIYAFPPKKAEEEKK